MVINKTSVQMMKQNLLIHYCEPHIKYKTNKNSEGHSVKNTRYFNPMGG
jgi:hypothetical protein